MAVVLVVDDSLLARHTVKLALRSLHHEVLEASDGIAGLLIARACLPDVVIAAQVLPATSGEALFAALKREGHTAASILIETPVPDDNPRITEGLSLQRPLCTKLVRAAVELALGTGARKAA
jgi:DNA-binding response OmpR family regulator